MLPAPAPGECSTLPRGLLSPLSDQKQLAVLVASAIEIAQPERIILLGSGARGEMVEDGGLDLLVVAGAPTGEPWRAGTGRRGYAGAWPSTSLLRHQRRSKPIGTTHAAAFTMRCAKAEFSTT